MSWILTSNVFICVAFLFLTKYNGPFFSFKTWRQHYDGNTKLTIFKLIFSEKYELLEQKMNSSVQKRPSIVMCVKIRHVSHLFHYEFLSWKKGGEKGVFFVTADLGHKKNHFLSNYWTYQLLLWNIVQLGQNTHHM